MSHLNNTSKSNFVKLDDCNNIIFAPQLHHNLLINNEIKLYPPILITSSSNIDRYIEVYVEKVLCDNILISGVISNKIMYTSTNKCSSKLYDVVKCYTTPFQAKICCSCNNNYLSPNDYEAHASIDNVISSNFSCIESLCNSSKLIALKLSEKYSIYITVQKKA
ncbi:MAG: hypothetical protein RSB70_05895 [Clostridium sp.]